MPRRLKTRTIRGYRQFWDEHERRWVYTHRRAVENILGRALSTNEHVHHINGNKQDNRTSNLVALKPSIHKRIHTRAPGACFRCGRTSHPARRCFAATDIDGEGL